ncbi:MAG: hypothetical protein ACRDXD_11685 [Acidimicrobiia bacterium]
MRTTVEISDQQHRALLALASKRGLRGFSQLVQEALDQYLLAEEDEGLESFLALRGILSDTEAEEIRRRIADARATWRSFE